jgi:hypothetical protein
MEEILVWSDEDDQKEIDDVGCNHGERRWAQACTRDLSRLAQLMRFLVICRLHVWWVS